MYSIHFHHFHNKNWEIIELIWLMMTLKQLITGHQGFSFFCVCVYMVGAVIGRQYATTTHLQCLLCCSVIKFCDTGNLKGPVTQAGCVNLVPHFLRATVHCFSSVEIMH